MAGRVDCGECRTLRNGLDARDQSNTRDRPRTIHIAHRLARVTRELLSQTKVFSGHRIVDLLHAIVFYEFILTLLMQQVT
jgi:hypothetical protein